ncbi:hypothetical protein RHMOL_Rhmol02G0117100 [Rhododendron molle]|uniref:Uncharacterized protein n=1 Tax=Rhododendron molle TaxID=49168 RepID=A0ACC0PRE2_RHOML|nr:hypothetical protein RHMOL_Rhmol02G0117100 [Rhododendron molle]
MDSSGMQHFVRADNSCISSGHAQSGMLGYGPAGHNSRTFYDRKACIICHFIWHIAPFLAFFSLNDKIITTFILFYFLSLITSPNYFPPYKTITQTKFSIKLMLKNTKFMQNGHLQPIGMEVLQDGLRIQDSDLIFVAVKDPSDIRLFVLSSDGSEKMYFWF